MRSTRPPQAGWLRAADGGYEVELADGEDGVSPGQACVFYDAGRARRACSAAASSRQRRRPAKRCRADDERMAQAARALNSSPAMGDIDKQSVERAYARWAPVYDLVFGAVFEPGRRAAIAAAEQACGPQGGRILEVGVGTGISLPDYARVNRLVGFDLSEPMLRKAVERVHEHKLDNVEVLAVMDAARLPLPDESFDVVVAQYVITAVPNPEATLDEFARVIKPGGEIVLVNHIGAESRPAPRLRAMLRADRAPARLAAGISLSAAGRLGRAPRRRARDRAARHAAARPFRAHPLRPRARCRRGNVPMIACGRARRARDRRAAPERSSERNDNSRLALA